LNKGNVSYLIISIKYKGVIYIFKGFKLRNYFKKKEDKKDLDLDDIIENFKQTLKANKDLTFKNLTFDEFLEIKKMAINNECTVNYVAEKLECNIQTAKCLVENWKTESEVVI